jgi:hypothetical protein
MVGLVIRTESIGGVRRCVSHNGEFNGVAVVMETEVRCARGRFALTALEMTRSAITLEDVLKLDPIIIPSLRVGHKDTAGRLTEVEAMLPVEEGAEPAQLCRIERYRRASR